jgi:hypothetical protein
MTICRRFLSSACLLVSLNGFLTEAFTFKFPCSKSKSSSRIHCTYTPLTCRRTKFARDAGTGDNEKIVDSSQRRGVLLSALLLVIPLPSYAGEVGARINAAVTQSELGVAVRESVVRGAQVMDKVDGQWEQFSDKFGLGTARSQQDKKPTPRDIPEPLPLDTRTAKRLVEITDQVRSHEETCDLHYELI